MKETTSWGGGRMQGRDVLESGEVGGIERQQIGQAMGFHERAEAGVASLPATNLMAVDQGSPARRNVHAGLLVVLAVWLIGGSAWAFTGYGDSNPFGVDTRIPGGTGYGASGSFSFDTRGNVGLNDRGTSGSFVLDTRSGGEPASTYNMTASATYSAGNGTIRILAYVYDLQNGAAVTTGTGSYLIAQGVATVGSGALTYSATSKMWDSGTVVFPGAGTYQVLVTINGQIKTTAFVVGSGTGVALTGSVTDDAGNPLTGATVKLYNASTVLGASNLNNLPAPVATLTAGANGTFDFGPRSVGQYIIVITTANGTTTAPAFWLKNGATTHSETVVENPGRILVLRRMLALKSVIRGQVVDRQTQWMHDVADTVDEDLDASMDLLDGVIMLANIGAGAAKGMADMGKQVINSTQLSQILMRQTAESVLQSGLELNGTVGLVELASVNSQSTIAKAALTQPYFAYGAGAPAELQGIDSALRTDVSKLFDPLPTGPFLNPRFSRNNPVHRHSIGWFQALDSYQFAQDWLQTYYEDGVTGLPVLPAQFDVKRAQLVFNAAEQQLSGLAVGSGQLFVGPHPSEWTSTTAPFEPLALNLVNYKSKYDVGRQKSTVLDWVSKGSGIVSAYFTGAAAVSAAGVVTLPGAAIGVTAAAVSQGVGFGASVYQAGIKAEMAATYVQMSAKYCANLLTAPLALKRTDDFLISEATNPYYLDKAREFAGDLGNISLGGSSILGREVFFPLQLNLLPFMPPIQLTGEKQASIAFTVPAGSFAPADYRVESKVTDFSGVHSHVVTRIGQYGAGGSGQIQVPFRGHMLANAIFTAGKLESRLWAGPFQRAIKTKDFVVMPINVGFSSLPLTAQSLQAEMQRPLGFVKMGQQSLSGEDIVALADRVRERVETNLVVGANVVEKTYAFANDVFEAEIRLYWLPGAKARLSVWEDGEYIGWDTTLEVSHLGFPGEHSGPDSNPEWIRIPNCAGRTLTVRVELEDVASEPVSILVEVWEKPARNAVLVVLPESVSIAVQPGQTYSLELGVGESSHQEPLQGVLATVSELRASIVDVLPWSVFDWAAPTNQTAGSVQVCKVDVDATSASEGAYTGIVSVTSANAGTVHVPVSIAVDGTPPAVGFAPVREWWHAEIGPVVNWVGQDNMTPASNLVYSVHLDGWNTDWSGFSATLAVDLTGLPDGTYTLNVVARDQALNATVAPSVLLIHIDRSGTLWKQRIVEANLEDDIIDVSQVNWTDDFDGDGMSNYEEYIAGTDPTNSADQFGVAGAGKVVHGFRIQWHAKRGMHYQVLKTFDLKNGPWVAAPSGAALSEQSQRQANTDGLLEYTDITVPGSQVFYKVQIQE